MVNTKTTSLYKGIPEVNRRLAMKYTKEERLDIGRKLYNNEITRQEAAMMYGISELTAREYMRLYRDLNRLPAKQQRQSFSAPSFKAARAGLEELESMTKEQLIQELVKARITEARLKKGYEVKGDGTVILYDKETSK